MTSVADSDSGMDEQSRRVLQEARRAMLVAAADRGAMDAATAATLCAVGRFDDGGADARASASTAAGADRASANRRG